MTAALHSKKLTPSQEVDRPMVDVLNRVVAMQDDLAKRLAASDQAAAEHREQDAHSFAELRETIQRTTDQTIHAIHEVKTGLESKIGDMQSQLSGALVDVATVKTDKLKADSYAAGLQDGKRPGPWASNIVPVVVGVVLSALIAGLASWVVHDYAQPSNEQHASTTTTTSAAWEGKPHR